MVRTLGEGMPHRAVRAVLLITAAAIGLGACGSSKGGTTGAEAGAVPDSVLMAHGLEFLYTKGDPIAATASFRKVLAQTPRHYGAHFQLATAYDRSGLPDQARPLWDIMRDMAAAVGDTATLGAVHARLAQPDTVSQEATMFIGLDLLYARRDAAAAADRFRQVLQRDATHYGARFQLARALERSGAHAEAAIVWQAVLQAAERQQDCETADTARARVRALAQ